MDVAYILLANNSLDQRHSMMDIKMPYTYWSQRIKANLPRLPKTLGILGMLLWAHQQAMASGFQAYALAAPISGTAGVGQAVIKDDASAAYFNPAAMVNLTHSQLLLGGQVLLFDSHFSTNSRNTIAGTGSGDIGGTFPGMGSYFVYHLAPKWRLGLSINSPYDGVINYNSNWAGRYLTQDISLITINANPSIAYQVKEWLAIGAGISAQYAQFKQSFAVPITQAATDGRVKINMDNIAYSYNLGALFTPAPGTQLGIAWRAPMTQDLRGDTRFANITPSPVTQSNLKLPATFIASLRQQVGEQWTLLGELGWSGWGRFNDTVVHIANVSAVIPRKWHNTWRAGMGGEWQANAKTTLQLGLAYDSSPVSSKNRLPDLPVDQQITLGTGIKYQFNSITTVSLAYDYVNLGRGKINQTTRSGTLAGDYPVNHANIIVATVNIII